MRFGMVGLGRMGGNLSLQAVEKGHEVVGYAPSGVDDPLREAGVEAAASLEDLVSMLAPPRVLWLYVPPGEPTESVIGELEGLLGEGDLIMDGGNAYWGDTLRRHERLSASGIRLIDVGTSGGVEGARRGASFMVGGDRDSVEQVEGVLRDLSEEGGYVHAGGPGAGHYVKIVHNGVLYGMLQSIGEGVEMVSHHPSDIDLLGVLRTWNSGGVISSFLLEALHEALSEEGEDLREIPAYVEDTGEVAWVIADAMHLEVPVPAIAAAQMALYQNRDPMPDWARAIAAMRHLFGGHPYGPDQGVAEERGTSRVGPYVGGRSQV